MKRRREVMTIVEKAAYLKGLAEGLGVDPDSREGKLWGALNDLLSDIAHEIEDLQSGALDFADTLDEFGDELGYLEELTCDLDRPEDFVETRTTKSSAMTACSTTSSAPSAARRSPSTRTRSSSARSSVPSAARRWSSTSPARTSKKAKLRTDDQALSCGCGRGLSACQKSSCQAFSPPAELRLRASSFLCGFCDKARGMIGP